MKGKKFRINLSSFDLPKGIAMIFVILVHMMKTDHYRMAELYLLKPVLVILPSVGFLMPMFFIISGFGFKEKTVSKMFKKTFSEMIVPYFFVMTAIAVLYPVFFYLNNHSWVGAIYSTFCYILAYLFGIPEYGKVILGNNVMWISAVWYLLSLFVAFNILNLILKMKSVAGQIVLVTLSVIIGYVLIIREVNYFCFTQGLMATGFCYTGYLIRKFKLLEKLLHCIWIYILLLPIALVHMIWGHFDLCLGEFNWGLLDYIGAGCAAILFMLIGVYFGQFEWKPLGWIKQIGAYTYWILCIHSVETGFPQWATLVDTFGTHQYLALGVEIFLKYILIASICFVIKRVSQYNYNRHQKHLLK